jgi:hypothetical protein
LFIGFKDLICPKSRDIMWLGFIEKIWNMVSLDTPLTLLNHSGHTFNIVKSQTVIQQSFRLGYRMDDQRSAVIPGRERLLCSPETPDRLLGPPSYQIGTVDSDQNMKPIILSIPPYIFMAWCKGGGML